MKTKFLLGVIPALLTLTSCAGIAPKAENKLFQEDALAHEEIFGEAKIEMEGYRAPRKSPELSPEPMYGVQYQVTESYVHMRLIAAVSLPDLSVSVQWARTMYKGHDNGEESGHVFKPSANFESTKAYTTLANGTEDPLTIAAFNSEYGTSYDHFVVYTMLNIPKATYDDYSIRASVTIGDVASTKGIAATVGQTAFASFDLARSGHFISGRFNGVHQEFASNHELGGNNAAYDVSLLPGDTFALVYYNGSDVFLLNGLSRFANESGYYFDGSKNTPTVKYKGDYTLYLNGGDMIYTSANNVVRPFYINLASWWFEASCHVALRAYDSSDDSKGVWFSWDTHSTYMLTSGTVDPSAYDTLVVVRVEDGHSPSVDSPKYGNKSKTISFPSAPAYDDEQHKVKDCLYIYGDGDPRDLSWGTRS